MSPRPLGYTTIAVLRAVFDGKPYGFDIIDATGLPSGTVYPALSTLERKGLLISRWEAEEVARDEGRPARRYYDVTPEGEAELADSLERFARLMGAGPEAGTSEA